MFFGSAKPSVGTASVTTIATLQKKYETSTPSCKMHVEVACQPIPSLETFRSHRIGACSRFVCLAHGGSCSFARRPSISAELMRARRMTHSRWQFANARSRILKNRSCKPRLHSLCQTAHIPHAWASAPRALDAALLAPDSVHSKIPRQTRRPISGGRSLGRGSRVDGPAGCAPAVAQKKKVGGGGNIMLRDLRCVFGRRR